MCVREPAGGAEGEDLADGDAVDVGKAEVFRRDLNPGSLLRAGYDREVSPFAQRDRCGGDSVTGEATVGRRRDVHVAADYAAVIAAVDSPPDVVPNITANSQSVGRIGEDEVGWFI